MTNEALLAWLKSKGDYIKIDRIAKEIEIPRRTLKAWVDGDRPLPEKHADKILNWIKTFRE
jgi:DNA-binding transcriptional regulator YiaG